MSVKTFGMGEFRKAITYNVKLAEATESFLRKSADWEVISPATLAVINFRYNPIGNRLSEQKLDALNQRISKNVVDSQQALLVTTVLNGQVVLRMCLINPRTTLDDVKETIALCESFAEEKVLA
jgi:glutamate/tyrosine decarboxylase-like PLP-dependent enzyme